MKQIRALFLFFTIFTCSQSFAGFGVNVGAGFPYVTSGGINYMISDQWSAELSYNMLSIDVDLASVSMTKPEVAIKWHPFSGSFFVGLGLGQLSLEATGKDLTTSLTATVKITAMTLTTSMGWLWGFSDGGFFGGLDFGYQSPMSPETTITSDLPTTDEAYKDAVEQGDKLGETGIPLFTFLRIGYLF